MQKNQLKKNKSKIFNNRNDNPELAFNIANFFLIHRSSFVV